MFLPFDYAVDGWQRQELPVLFIRAARRLEGMFGQQGVDAAGHLEDVFARLSEFVTLGDTMRQFGTPLADGATPLMVRNLTVVGVVTAKQAMPMLLSKAPYAAHAAFRTALEQDAVETGSAMRKEFLEFTLRSALEVLEYRISRILSETMPVRVASLAAKTTREILLFECWDKVNGKKTPLVLAAQDLRRVGALPLWIEPCNAVTILAAEQEAQT